MMLRIGTDLVEVARLERLIGTVGAAFLARTWTERELADCAGRPESLAARWAAKEAVLKALGAGIDQIAMTDIEVRPGPSLFLAGRAADRAAVMGLIQWEVSLAHDGGFALAFVAALGDATTSEPMP